MQVIDDAQGRTLAASGRFMFVFALAISRAVKRLEARGLVERAEHASDRRRRPLRLSPDRGRPVFEEIVPRGSLDPDHIHLPGIYVHRLIQGEHEKRIEQRTVRAA